MKTALEWKKYYSSPEFRDNYIYDGDDLGVSCTGKETSFKLWSPSADSVTLNLFQEGSGGSPYQKIPMKRENKGVWSWKQRSAFTESTMILPLRSRGRQCVRRTHMQKPAGSMA